MNEYERRIKELKERNHRLRMEKFRLETTAKTKDEFHNESKKELRVCLNEKDKLMAKNAKLDLKYHQLKSQQELFDVTMTAQGSKKVVREYNEIKEVINTVKEQ